jgi:hypothetical protein
MSKISPREAVLAALPGTVAEITRKIRGNESAVRDHLKMLHMAGKVHVSKARLHRNQPPGPTWSAGPAGPDSPPQPTWKAREQAPKDRQPYKPKPVAEDKTISRARANPATWFSGLQQ